MRISTSMLFQQGAAKISDLQSNLVKTQQQLSTGRRILTPADDPVAAARALDVTQSQSVNAQYATNRQTAVSSLTAVDSTLASVTTVLQDVKTQTVYAGNGTLSNSDRSNLATQLSSDLDQLLSLANSTDGIGNYLFSGYQTGTQPFVKTATGAQYNGDQGQRQIQVDSSRQMAVSDSGQAIFQGNNQDVFKTLTDLITLLQTPVSTPAGNAALTAGLSAANGNIDQSLNNVLTTRASVGSRLKELDALNSAGSSRDIQYSQTLSQLQDVDYAKAISQLTQQQTTLQAAQQSFVKIAGLSLFNYL
ncbi:MAG: flagellar hook-associated protein FlgL [Sulfuriferula sp.]